MWRKQLEAVSRCLFPATIVLLITCVSSEAQCLALHLKSPAFCPGQVAQLVVGLIPSQGTYKSQTMKCINKWNNKNRHFSLSPSYRKKVTVWGESAWRAPDSHFHAMSPPRCWASWGERKCRGKVSTCVLLLTSAWVFISVWSIIYIKYVCLDIACMQYVNK